MDEQEAIRFAEQSFNESVRRKALERAAEAVKCEEVLTFARQRPELQGSEFLASCESWYQEHGFLSKAQVQSLMPLAADRERQAILISTMLDKAQEHNPKSSFLMSLRSFFQNRGYLTKKQLASLEDIYGKLP